MRAPSDQQADRLARFLRDGADTAYGRAHRYEKIHSFRSFQDRVPIVAYDDLHPYVERIAQGERYVLTRSPVRMLQPTSGSTSRRKLIPYTDGLLADFAAATNPWLADLYRHFPRLKSTRQYWSISPVSPDRERSSGGLPLGFEDDAEYFGPVARWALGRIRAVPAHVAKLPFDAWRNATARGLLEARNLGLISVWSPSFLLLLMEHIEREAKSILATLNPSRRAEVRAALDRHGGRASEALWPALQVVSLWADGAAADLIGRVRERFPTTTVQPKGLLATEGVVTLPLFAMPAGGVPALASHVIELRDLNDLSKRPIPVQEAQEGGSYAPLLSTGNGFARYRLDDVMTCTARVAEVPLFRFEGRLEGCDLRGEKLSSRLVQATLREAAAQTGVTWEFALLAPVAGEPPHYKLYVETRSDDRALGGLAKQVEIRLCEVFHYKYCRDLGQLGPVTAARISEGRRCYEAALVARGMRQGDIKPTCLDARPIWSAVFGVVDATA